MQTDFDEIIKQLGEALLFEGEPVEVPTWQALDVSDKPQGKTVERYGVSLYYDIPRQLEFLQQFVKPNLPWAENHFKERVSGEPLNPPPSHSEWPWARHNAEHQQEEKFSHTYPERYWPHRAEHLMSNGHRSAKIGDALGDLSDVVAMLAKDPTTRQAYLPVFFPFDTGAVHGERIPCSLGYQFLMRGTQLHIIYGIRSCDFYRHFRDDVYMTCRLAQWVLDEIVTHKMGNHHLWEQVEVGKLIMHIGSLHVFEGDLPRLERDYAPPES